MGHGLSASGRVERRTRGVLGALSGLSPVSASAVVAAGLAGSWLVAYVVGGASVAAPHWFYLPVLYAAARFGCRGAALSAVGAGLLAGLLLPSDVSADVAQQPADWLTRAAFFVIIGQAMALVIGQSRLSIAAEFERAQLEREIRAGIQRGEFVLHYQPIVELESGEVVGVEALVRWQHPERGLLLPGSFIPLAETSSLIVELGEQVLEIACRQLVAWRGGPLRHRDFKFAVNVSARQLAEPGFVGFVDTMIRSHGVPPSWLHLEITETALIAELQETSAKLDELKALGVALAIDDFGTGHASLSYLHKLPVDVVKIDQTFIASLGAGGRADSVSRAVIQLANTLDMKAVAEGVEAAHQIHLLRLLGCHFAQGHHFSPAQPAEYLLPLLHTPAPYAHLTATAHTRLALVS
jgi:EAL domain-containing protein (putative c-di-GMP-specific phosphodiesterase class I)